MRPILTAAILSSLFCAIQPSFAQKQHRDVLTPAQVEEIREAGIDPDGRVKLYTKYLNERADTIESLTKRGHSAPRAHRLDNELQDFAALMDELGSNLDEYGDRKADLRKSLKFLNESAQHWVAILHNLPSEPGFELSLKDATDGGQDLADEAKQMLTEQTAYFNEHKDQRGQDRAEPQ
ncbi:MAG TPA: hypothetical protein VKR52_05860 [Terracidiphilus sp.]|nr:hypothetical protein [Terracidiphilus sp.]